MTSMSRLAVSTPSAPTDPVAALQPEDFDLLDDLLDALREQDGQTPQWEFCEGFMAALVCCRRPIPAAEYLPLLLETESEAELASRFPDAQQFDRFKDLWARRWNEVVAGLDADVDSLDDEKAYCPQVLDVRGAMAALPPEQRAEALGRAAADGEDPEQLALPAFAQVWALGFMFAVECWPDEWVTSGRDKVASRRLEQAMEALSRLCEDDPGPPEVSAFEADEGGDGPPSMSAARLEAFGEAVWAVYDLREIWQSFGPRVEPVRRVEAPGRNDPCHCGSGRKYKKCHGAV